MPVSGSNRTMPAMMKKAWKPMIMVRPTAVSLANSDLATWAMRNPAPTRRRNATTTMAAITRSLVG